MWLFYYPDMDILDHMRYETDYDYLRRRLAETVGQHNQIAQLTGVPQATVSRIHLGAMPRLNNAQKLLAYFRQLDRKGKSAVRRASAGRHVQAAADGATAPALCD